MHLGRFVLFTSLGAGLWVSVLVVLGYVVGQNEALVGKYLHDATLIAFIFVVGLIVFYWLRHRAKEVDV
jgi:membrane protein DedA with SNARE-associated domain